MRGIPFLTICSVLALALAACQPVERTPSIYGIEPDFGSTAGGESITLVGGDFGDHPRVDFGTSLASSVIRVDSGLLVVTTPPGVEGPVDVTVTNGDGKGATRTEAFTYQDPALSPTLASISPESGYSGGGTGVTLTGTGFQNGATVQFEGVAAGNIVVQSPTSITVTTTVMPEGTLDVLVINPDGRKATLLGAFQSTGLTSDEYEVLLLVNQERANAGLPPLAINPELTRAARNHSQDMIDRNFFSHTNPDGNGPAQRAAAEGYPSSYVGENIAAGYWTPQAVMDAWMNSPGHRANILNANYTEIGIGWKQGGSYGVYWTQVFGKP